LGIRHLPRFRQDTFETLGGFFRTASAAHNNLAFSGASPDNRLSYRFETSTLQQDGVVPNSNYNRINLTGSSRAQVKEWLTADLLHPSGREYRWWAELLAERIRERIAAIQRPPDQ